MMQVRPPAVAGMFYPGDAATLRRAVAGYLDEAAAAGSGAVAAAPVKALIAPHAGYVYSGPVAARAYALLQARHAEIRRVVLLGPVHRVWVPGLALPEADAFATPLGTVAVDGEAVAALADLPQVERNGAAHAQEHSLEVHLPFLQGVLDRFSLVPLAVGGASPEQVAEVLERLWGGPETLIVVSSDLSHYLPYARAREVDAATASAIVDLSGGLVGDMACGAHPVNGLLLAARRKGLAARLLDLRNSGDTAGDRARVVGYGAFVFSEATPS